MRRAAAAICGKRGESYDALPDKVGNPRIWPMRASLVTQVCARVFSLFVPEYSRQQIYIILYIIYIQLFLMVCTVSCVIVAQCVEKAKVGNPRKIPTHTHLACYVLASLPRYVPECSPCLYQLQQTVDLYTKCIQLFLMVCTVSCVGVSSLLYIVCGERLHDYTISTTQLIRFGKCTEDRSRACT